MDKIDILIQSYIDKLYSMTSEALFVKWKNKLRYMTVKDRDELIPSLFIDIIKYKNDIKQSVTKDYFEYILLESISRGWEQGKKYLFLFGIQSASFPWNNNDIKMSENNDSKLDVENLIISSPSNINILIPEEIMIRINEEKIIRLNTLSDMFNKISLVVMEFDIEDDILDDILDDCRCQNLDELYDDCKILFKVTNIDYLLSLTIMYYIIQLKSYLLTGNFHLESISENDLHNFFK